MQGAKRDSVFLARLSERAELLMKEEFTSKVDELIGEDKREEYAKIKKNISGDDEDARQNRQKLYPLQQDI